MSWLKTKWAGFEAWVYSWFPGFKTEIMAVLGGLGNVAFLMQNYLTGLTGLPSNVVTGTQLAIASAVLFSLAFWFRGMGDRVAANAGLTPLA